MTPPFARSFTFSTDAFDGAFPLFDSPVNLDMVALVVFDLLPRLVSYVESVVLDAVVLLVGSTKDTLCFSVCFAAVHDAADQSPCVLRGEKFPKNEVHVPNAPSVE